MEASRAEWDAAMAAAAKQSEHELRLHLEAKATEQFTQREQFQNQQSDERKHALAAKDAELQRTQVRLSPYRRVRKYSGIQGRGGLGYRSTV